MIKINCKKCGAFLASHDGKIITHKGQKIPTENIDGIIFKCDCKRIRTYYFRENTEDTDKKNTISAAFYT